MSDEKKSFTLFRAAWTALKAGIARDCDAARAFFASTHAETRRQTTRDRI